MKKQGGKKRKSGRQNHLHLGARTPRTACWRGESIARNPSSSPGSLLRLLDGRSSIQSRFVPRPPRSLSTSPSPSRRTSRTARSTTAHRPYPRSIHERESAGAADRYRSSHDTTSGLSRRSGGEKKKKKRKRTDPTVRRQASDWTIENRTDPWPDQFNIEPARL